MFIWVWLGADLMFCWYCWMFFGVRCVFCSFVYRCLCRGGGARVIAANKTTMLLKFKTLRFFLLFSMFPTEEKSITAFSSISHPPSLTFRSRRWSPNSKEDQGHLPLSCKTHGAAKELIETIYLLSFSCFSCFLMGKKNECWSFT